MSVAVFAFQRGRYNAAFEAPWPQVALGRTADARYLQRIRALIGALPVIWRERRLLRRASLFYDSNIDQLFLAFASALLAGHTPVQVYEVRDAVPVSTRDTVTPRIPRPIARASRGHVPRGRETG